MASSTLMQNFEIALIEAGCKAVYRIESVRSQRGKLLSVEFGCCPSLHENVARAFQQIMSWRSGTFETLPVDRNRQRRILNSVQGLLLDSAQSLDEIQAGEVAGSGGVSSAEGSAMARLVNYPGVEFALETHTSKKRQVEHFACEDPELVAKWGRETTARFSNMGELLGAGRLEHVVVSSSQRNASLAFSQDRILCLGTDPKLKPAAVLELTRKVEVQWAS
jgi:hypothetical protein